MKAYIIINEKDNVATALRNLQKEEILENIKLLNDIASANCDIKAGEWVHIHNTSGIRGRGDKNEKNNGL